MSAPAPGPVDPVARVLDLVEHKRSGANWVAVCPAHADGSPSLSIKRTPNGDALLYCHAGCETAEVMASIGLTMADLYRDGRDRPKDVWRASGQPIPGARPRLQAVQPSGRRAASRSPLGPVVASYDYRDESGAVLFTKTRHEPKDFRVKRPDGSWGIGDARRVLYRLPDVLAAVRSTELVWVVEGEKDADRLTAMGLAATCNFDGAAKTGTRTKWRPEYGDQLAGAHVVIVRDLDEAGAGHALAAFDDLTGKAASVRIVEPATGSEHDDVSDHLDAGHDLDALVPVDTAALRGTTHEAEPDEAVVRQGPLDDEALNAIALPVLPAEFWEARLILRHIRQAAHSRNRSADVLLYSTLARTAAVRSHHVAADTGVGASRASLNLLLAIVGRSGAGKSSGNSGARHLLPLHGAVDLLDGMPLGTGEGIAEAFMGSRQVEVPGPNGRTRQARQRAQIHYNASFYLDEGEALTKMLERAGTTVGPTLRSAWGGETLGQQNASDDRTRIVRDYSLGIVIGFQPSTILPLLDDAEAGTPQRFLYASATDPNIPDVQVAHPGPLPVDIVALAEPGESNIGFARAIRQEIYAADLAQARGERVPPLLDSHEPLARVKIAALLALLEGRREVNAEDWALALIVWTTSCKVRDRLVAEGERRKARREWVRRQSYVEDQVGAAVAVEDDRTVRVARRVTRAVREAAPDTAKPYVVRRVLASRDRQMFETAIDYAVSQRWLERRADGDLSVGASQPTEDVAS